MTTPASTSASNPTAPRTVSLPGGLTVTIQEFGENTEGTGVLVLHGGAGPRTVAGISAALSEHVYVVTPTHPGFDGTPRPERFDTVADLAIAYLDLLDTLDLKGVMVIGNSIGGWIAAEMALRDNQGRIGALTLLNAVGIHAHMAENRVVDPRTLAPSDVSQLSFAKAEFRPDFASFTDAQRAAAGANQKTLAVYGGDHFTYDPKLRARLHRVTVPVLVVWGEEDGIAPLKYGRGYADSFPNGHFAPIADAAHFPQIEALGATLGAIGTFVSTVVKPGETD
ncbi:alpha/beta hydrolase [Streptomyces sp. N50]|uniref:alpha/beta fold hydrolase n=1 Tax=Streptomyces sp. N50 TaxID=3081765 RepID=UPI002962216A|nr:alpha/beta hydrolase [Streptomyces sp. N50]WOX11168.1 alpha/beta hydrolase [Streptomyces sp. N50]